MGPTKPTPITLANEEGRNNGLHPRHPGRGQPAALLRLEEPDRPECGGFLLFLPSGATKTVSWRSSACITPTLEAAKDYTSRVANDIIQQHGVSHEDVQKVNWTSVCAAVQRIILDFNDRLQKRINQRITLDLTMPKKREVTCSKPILH